MLTRWEGLPSLVEAATASLVATPVKLTPPGSGRSTRKASEALVVVAPWMCHAVITPSAGAVQ
jgi:hypothetical protein